MPFIDISLPIREGMIVYEGDPGIAIGSAASTERGDPANVSSLKLGSHTGTHMDAPLHFIEGAKSIDTVPLEVPIGPALLLEVDADRLVEPRHLTDAADRDARARAAEDAQLVAVGPAIVRARLRVAIARRRALADRARREAHRHRLSLGRRVRRRRSSRASTSARSHPASTSSIACRSASPAVTARPVARSCACESRRAQPCRRAHRDQRRPRQLVAAAVRIVVEVRDVGGRRGGRSHRAAVHRGRRRLRAVRAPAASSARASRVVRALRARRIRPGR
ncbi:MAG: cyclase family protein [Candidatus Rokubacteria bacterium]|nr:cyclase family protein [Candidatus Rokubacteria bacterium]